jgi:hypothetical protein
LEAQFGADPAEIEIIPARRRLPALGSISHTPPVRLLCVRLRVHFCQSHPRKMTGARSFAAFRIICNNASAASKYIQTRPK